MIILTNIIHSSLTRKIEVDFTFNQIAGFRAKIKVALN